MGESKLNSNKRSSAGLDRTDFMRIVVNGFGDPQNSYVHSMAWYKDHVYMGTSRHILALLKLFPPPDGASMDPWPVNVPDRVEDLDLRAQIWRWDPASGGFEHLHTSPDIIGRNGKEVPRDLGYRGMVVFQGRSDPEPALYVSTVSSVSRGTGARVLRSSEGLKFDPVSEPGLGNPNISTFRSLVAFDGHLYAAPAGEGKTWNTTKAPKIFRCADPLHKEWELACEPGFGDPNNTGIFELAVFDDHLYAGTFNHIEGYQVWKTPATGDAPCRWTKALGHGAYRGSLNEMAMSLCAFKDAIYVGSGIQNGGYDRWNIIGPAAGEVVRIYPDNSWDLVVGTPRQTPEGMRYPLSGMGPGFDNVFAGYKWRMGVHDGWIYLSTFDWSVFLPYATRVEGLYKDLMRGFGADHLIRMGGGFELWRSEDGIQWVPVTRNGMGNPYNYGARTFLSSPYGFLLGTANPFGPEVAVKTATGWKYIPNPDGGAEVWLGRKRRRPSEELVSEPAASTGVKG